MSATTESFFLVWNLSSFRRNADGYLVHATTNAPGPTLCGRHWNDGGFGIVGKDGEPGCILCQKKLEKLRSVASQPNTEKK